MTLNRLQLVQNSAARLLTKTKKRAHITPVLKALQWLPVTSRIDFKMILLVYKSLHGLASEYLKDLLLRYAPCRALRSSDSHLLQIPRIRTKTFGEASFRHYGPKIWNALPEDLRKAETFLKRNLKRTFLILLLPVQHDFNIVFVKYL